MLSNRRRFCRLPALLNGDCRPGIGGGRDAQMLWPVRGDRRPQVVGKILDQPLERLRVGLPVQAERSMVWMFRNLRGRTAMPIRSGTSFFSSTACAASARTQSDLVEAGDQM